MKLVLPTMKSLAAVTLALAAIATGCRSIRPFFIPAGTWHVTPAVRKEMSGEGERRGREAARKFNEVAEERRRRLEKAIEEQQAAEAARTRRGRATELLISFKFEVGGPLPAELGMAFAYWSEGDFENGDRLFEAAKRKSDRTSEWEAGAFQVREFWSEGLR